MINVFIPHRWNNSDYSYICNLLDRTKYKIRDYSVPASSPFDVIDRRFNVDPQIQKQIRYASVVVCSKIDLQIVLGCLLMKSDMQSVSTNLSLL